MTRAFLVALALLAGGAPPASAETRPVTLVFGGDVMLGRGVARAAPTDALTGLRAVLSSADLAAANLESPLTMRPHLRSHGPNALEARPRSARLLRAAGFDVLGVANNHAGDAGPRTVTDTVHALDAAGLRAVGGGATAKAAYAPRIVRIRGVRVALLDFDATLVGPSAGSGAAGVATWRTQLVRRAVLDARARADVVAVGVHGGAEYVSETDPHLLHLARQLAGWGADVVWGSGPHVVQPVRTVRGAHGRVAVVATSLGNLVFDQHVPGTQRGALLEVLAGRDGVRAFRVASTVAYPPARLLGWRPPQGDAVAVDEAWWTLARPVDPAPQPHVAVPSAFPGTVVDASVGDAEGSGGRQLVVAFRRPFRPTNVSGLVPRSRLVDSAGLSAHLGLYHLRDLKPLWVAGTLLRPIARVAACDGAVAVAYSTLDRPRIVGTSAWIWSGFGFTSLPTLAGGGRPACANVDGSLDPVVLQRSHP